MELLGLYSITFALIIILLLLLLLFIRYNTIQYNTFI